MIDVRSGKPVWALGLMSGTSLDGIDAALLRTDGQTISDFGMSSFLPFRGGDLTALPKIWADWTRYRDAAGSDAITVAEAGQEVDALHAMASASLLIHEVEPPEVIGYHGQTVGHAPEDGFTWQIGDGAAVARALNRPVVWDFRTQDMTAGGQGAPLAPFYHYALAKWLGAAQPLAFLNIGGVGNVTWIDPALGDAADPGACVAFDTGPGNALVNDWVVAQTGQPFDRDGGFASCGTVHSNLTSGNFGTSFLARPGPKSLDRNDFQGVLAAVEGLSTEDGAATLTAFTAECVAASVQHMPAPPNRWLVGGGGRHNATMMAMLADRLDAQVDPVEAVGLDGDMLEAQAFAYLAVRVLRGLPTSAPSTTGCSEPVCGGRISYP